MTPGERMVWAAVYAATWSRLRRNDPSKWATNKIAADAVYEADLAVSELRDLPENGWSSVKEIIGDKP